MLVGGASAGLFAQGSVPKEEAFIGYSYYHSGATIQTGVPNFTDGWAAQFAFNMTHWAGIAVDGNGHYNDFGHIHTITAGPQFKLRGDRFTPFAEALIGFAQISPKNFPSQSTMTAMAGGGVDIRVNSHFSIRAAQVDVVTSSYNKLSPVGQLNQFTGYRAQAGLIFNFGGRMKTAPPEALCDANPNTVLAGSPVKIDVTASGFLTNHPPSYTYSTSGGRVIGSSQTVQVDTTGLAAGTYTVSAMVSDNGRGGNVRTAHCTADFAVKELPKHPPAIALAIEPNPVRSGESAKVTASASSPDQRPLTYNCTASAGRISGSGPEFTLDTTGVPAGVIDVKCAVRDDRQLTAAAEAELDVTPPPPPAAAPAAKEFGVVKFERDAMRPARVDNEAKGELDRYADALALAPESRGVVVGDATPFEQRPKKGGKPEADLAAQRAVNTKLYLTADKGIDPRRIQVRSGVGGQQAELWIVGPEASFPNRDTLPVDEAKVKAVPRTARQPHRAAPRKKAKAAAPAQPAAAQPQAAKPAQNPQAKPAQGQPAK